MPTPDTVHVVVAGHGGLATGLLSAVEVIIGAREAVTAVDLEPHEDPAGFGDRLAAVAHGHEAAPEVLFLTDLPGATPFAAAARIARDTSGARVVSGVNLPMLLETLLRRGGTPPADLVDVASEAGRAGVTAWAPNCQH